MNITEIKLDLIAHGGNLPGIYKITRKSDGKVYIGQTEKPIAERIEQHINNKHINRNSDNIDHAIKNEGIDAFKYEVELFLPHADTDQLWDLESQYISKYNSYNNGFNLTKGNHVGNSIKNTASYIMHTVKVELFKKLAKKFNLDFTNKTVLLINSFGKFVKAHLDYEDCIVTEIFSSAFVEPDNNGELKVNSKEYGKYIMEELIKLKGKHFDIIISNPPYSSIGANISSFIKDNIDYDEFVNLLPANDYTRNDKHDLFKYTDLSNMIAIKDGFTDAAVTTHATRIFKEPCMYITEEAFEIENYIDPIMKKYFYENRKRTHAAIDNAVYKPALASFKQMFDLKKCFYIGKRDLTNEHLPYSKNCLSYKVNVEHSVTHDDIINLSAPSEQANGNVGDFSLIQLDTDLEQNNMAEFFYSPEGFRFFAKIAVAMNLDSYCAPSKYMPKVDWKKKQTVKSILKEYKYTPEEIDAVIADLNNFKGMKD